MFWDNGTLNKESTKETKARSRTMTLYAVILYLQKQSEDSEIRYLRKQTEAVKDKDY